jgi:superfamily I DNA/RNA helicase
MKVFRVPDFPIADSFSDSLTALTAEEQKAVKTTAFDLQMNPANPGMSLHRLDKARDKNFWSVRVNADADLLGYGVPPEWLETVRGATDVSLLEIADHLPAEAAEALLELATGGRPPMPQPAAPGGDPFAHPDAQRRFRIMANADELGRALDFPWEKWTVFLHPEQRQWVERQFSGPAKVSGSAGTGKTIVALHRAAHLARTHPDARVLLTTFSEALANALHTRLRRLLSSEPRLGERIDVCALPALGARLFKAHVGAGRIGERNEIRKIVREIGAATPGHKFSAHFLITEWEQVVDAWGLASWEEYRDVARLGRKTRLAETQRRVLWGIYGAVLAELKQRSLVTADQALAVAAAAIRDLPNPIYDFAVVDEAQDLGVAQLRFLSALGCKRADSLFFAGDLGQRIFQQPFSWKSLGVDVRGRAKTLRVNYRTSHQIRSHADRLLDPALTDVDGNVETRTGTVSVFNGPPPIIKVHETEADEIAAVGAWMRERLAGGVLPHECGVFVRSDAQLDRARAAVDAAGVPARVLDEHVETHSGSVSIATMHLAKGLEFRTVVVMACDDEVVPLQERIEAVGDDADLQEVYDTERHLLYVACTRARDHLVVCGVGPESEFLDDLSRRGSGKQ